MDKMKSLLIVLVLSFASISNAAIISIDDSVFGADSLTRDTETNLDWLDLTNTNGLSYGYVLSQLNAGGLYDGYRYATLTEVQSLLLKLAFPFFMVGME